MKKLIIIALLTLASCAPKTENVTEDYRLPEKLRDCEIYKAISSSGNRLYIVRCPNSQTTTRESGKHPNDVYYEDSL